MANVSKIILFSFLMLDTMIINCNITKIKPAAQKLAALCTQRSICTISPTAAPLTLKPACSTNEIEVMSYKALEAGEDIDIADELWTWSKRFEKNDIKSNPLRNEIVQALRERKFDEAEKLVTRSANELPEDENIDRNMK